MISDEQATALAGTIEQLTRSTPGIETLYPVGGTAARIVDGAAEAVGLRPARCPVTVDVDGQVTVRLSVGTDSSCGAGDVARTVHRAIVDLFRASGLEAPLVHLTVARVAEPPAMLPGTGHGDKWAPSHA